MNDALEKFKNFLREEYRMKYGCDYSWTYKYGLLNVVCYYVYEDRIRNEAPKFLGETEIQNVFVYK